MKFVLPTAAAFAAVSMLAACGYSPQHQKASTQFIDQQDAPSTDPARETVEAAVNAQNCIKTSLFKDATKVTVSHSGRSVYVTDQQFYAHDDDVLYNQGEGQSTKINLFFNRGFDSARSLNFSSFTPLNPNDSNDVSTISIMENCVKNNMPNAMDYNILKPLPALTPGK